MLTGYYLSRPDGVGKAASQFGMGQTNLLRPCVEVTDFEDAVSSVLCDFPLEKLCVGLRELFFPFMMSPRSSLAFDDAVSSVFCDFPLEKYCVGLTALFFPFVMSPRRSLASLEILSSSGIAVKVSPLSKELLPPSNEDGGRGRDLKGYNFMEFLELLNFILQSYLKSRDLGSPGGFSLFLGSLGLRFWESKML